MIFNSESRRDFHFSVESRERDVCLQSFRGTVDQDGPDHIPFNKIPFTLTRSKLHVKFSR